MSENQSKDKVSFGGIILPFILTVAFSILTVALSLAAIIVSTTTFLR